MTRRGVLPGLLLATSLLQGCGGSVDSGQDVTTTAPGSFDLASVASPALDPASTKFRTLDGKALELEALAGHKVFLNYWATWCAPCIREIPSINRAAAILEPEGYVFLLASDETPERIQDFLEEREFPGNFIKLNGFFGGHGIDAVPSSELYGEDGTLLGVWPGAFEWDSAEMLAELRAAASKTQP